VWPLPIPEAATGPPEEPEILTVYDQLVASQQYHDLRTGLVREA
jgi:hypothetical protein